MHENTVEPLRKYCADGEIVLIEFFDSKTLSSCESGGIHVLGSGVRTVDIGRPSVMIPYSSILNWRLYKDEYKDVS